MLLRGELTQFDSIVREVFYRGDDRLALILRPGPCYRPLTFEPSHFTTTDAVQGPRDAFLKAELGWAGQSNRISRHSATEASGFKTAFASFCTKALYDHKA